MINERTLADFGQRVLDSIPLNKRKGSPTLEELAFHHLTFPLSDLDSLLRNTTVFDGRYVTALGKAEWSNMRWEKGIADKRTLIDSVHFVFTAAETPEACRTGQRRLLEEGITIPLLDCSDAHHPSTSSEKDRLGHTYSWMKADPTFAGLRQVLNDPNGRIYLGDKPPKLALVEQRPTKFLDSIAIAKRVGSLLSEEWFNNLVELNHDFVAIIGNKGMGKSALTDIIALTGHADAPATSYGFLDPNHFRDDAGKAAHFTATAVWRGGPSTTLGLADSVPPAAVPHVRYIPQNYFEELCNDVSDTGQLQRELHKVIYSHLDDTETLGHPTLQDLINDRTAEADREIAATRARLSGLNRRIIALERTTTITQLATLDNEISLRQAELSAHDGAAPLPVEPPGPVTTTPAIEAAAGDRVRTQADIDSLRDTLSNQRTKRAMALDLEARLFAFSESAVQLRDDTQASCDALGLGFDELVHVEVDLGRIALRREAIEAEIADIVSQHAQMSAHLSEVQAQITELTDALDAPQRAYQRYQEERDAWQQQHTQIADSIALLIQRRESLQSATKEELCRLRQERRELSVLVHERQLSKARFQRGLYARLQERLSAEPIIARALPFEFDATLIDSGFAAGFNQMINHTSKGSFSEPEAILQRLGAIDVNDAKSLAAGLDGIVTDMFEKKDVDNVERQLKKAYGAEELYAMLFGLEYLDTRYSIRVKGRELTHLTPGERGSVLLVFYLIADNDDRPLIVDQPEENLDNQSLYELVVPCIEEAKKRRQIIMVTHNPNLAVVCDAEQIIWCHIDKERGNKVTYQLGSLENPEMNRHVVDVLEGTWPAFKTRTRRYQE